MARWPDKGCRASFIPWARGLRVVDLKLANGAWQTSCAERMPEVLDDAVKECPREVLHGNKEINGRGTLGRQPVFQ